MHNPVSRLLERYVLHQAVGNALDSGVGIYRMSWRAGGRGEQELADEVLRWCRATLSKTHRPYGVDSVSLALLAHNRGKRPSASIQFALLRPADFYATGRVESDARDVLQTWLGEGILSRRSTRLSALLFSWGDLAQELVRTGSGATTSFL